MSAASVLLPPGDPVSVGDAAPRGVLGVVVTAMSSWSGDVSNAIKLE